MEKALIQDSFNRQLRALIEKYGAETFAAPPGQRPPRTLFVEGEKIVVEPADSPRYPYGFYFESPTELHGEELADAMAQWIDTGEAYAQQLSMNICRYNC